MVTIILQKNFKLKKESLIKKLIENKIQTRSMWLPIHLQKKYKKFQKYEISQSLKLFKKSINIPSSTNLSKAQMITVVNTLSKI
jgi:dTDP-4-amino-4,6-dideoxygalactose transaminase